MMRYTFILLSICLPCFLTAQTSSNPPSATDTNTLDIFIPPTTVGDAVGTGHIIDIKNYNGTYDAGFVCSVVDLSQNIQSDVHIIRIEPQVTEFADYGPIVHHMDLFACQDSPVEEYNAQFDRKEQNRWCEVDSFLRTSCKQILWAYDKGAGAFDFPNNTGIVLGPSSGFDSVVMQIHYLLPENYEPDGKGFEDASGFRLFTEPANKRRYDLGMFGFIGVDLDIPPGEPSFEYRAHLTAEQLKESLSTDFNANNDQVYPVAVHLHGHEHMIGARLEHYRNNELIGTYGEIQPYHGYGKDQSFIDLTKGGVIHLTSSPGEQDTEIQALQPLLKGDTLTYVCTYKSKSESHHMRHGVSHGDEMCAPLIMYYPKVRGREGRVEENISWVVKEVNVDLGDVEDEV